ncbi:MAG: helicase-related protein, partial [Planctomycetota bacterium]
MDARHPPSAAAHDGARGGDGDVAAEAARLRSSLPPPLRRRFGRGLGDIARGRRRGRNAERLLAAARSEAARIERRAAMPLRLDPPPDTLPIAEHWESLGRAIAAHPVVVVQGATGSGKSTQIPRLCAALGRGVDGRIAVTQPRRLAARAIATRLAEECAVELGTGVGWRTRFERRDGPATRIEVMTDGVLAASIGRDPRFGAYDTVIVDEAHERSVVIDLLLGTLKRAVEVRDDLRVVVASATIAADRFAAFFGGAPIVEIPGRQHPVEILHRPFEAGPEAGRGRDRDAALLEATGEAVDEALERQAGAPGDVLVFLPTTRAIDDLAELLAGRLGPKVPLLPLHARLDAAAQDAAFRRPSGPRVILATNVAETSLTLPWVRSVVDTGLARVRRYDPRRRIARLRVEPIARANAAQRAGRCGRVGPGTCLRLYAEEDLAKRPEFMPPEILRTGLAGVVLELAHRRLPPIEAFPWIDPPAAVRIEEARRTLRELGALESDER